MVSLWDVRWVSPQDLSYLNWPLKVPQEEDDCSSIIISIWNQHLLQPGVYPLKDPIWEPKGLQLNLIIEDKEMTTS